MKNSNFDGFMTYKDYSSLLNAMAFPMDNVTQNQFIEQYSPTLTQLKNELTKESNIFRFRLFELMFMERCAIY